MFFCGALIVGEWGVLGGSESLIQGQLKSYPFPVGILAEAISMAHSGILYRMDIYKFYFYAVSDFRPLGIYKNLGLPLSTITLTVNSHADNHFYKYIYFFQILYSMNQFFLLKYTLKFFIFKFDLNVKHRSHSSK